MRISLGHDYGKRTDFAATCISASDVPPRHVQILQAKRHLAQTPYSAQAIYLCQTTRLIRERYPEAEIFLLADGSGVGVAAVEMLLATEVLSYINRFYSVTFTGGQKIAYGAQSYELNVPKRELVRITAHYQRSGLLIYPVNSTELQRELRNFEIKPGKGGRWKAEAKRGHDDLVCSLLLSVFGLQIAL